SSWYTSHYLRLYTVGRIRPSCSVSGGPSRGGSRSVGGYRPLGNVNVLGATTLPTSSWMTSCGLRLMDRGSPEHCLPLTNTVTLPVALPTWLPLSCLPQMSKSWPRV